MLDTPCARVSGGPMNYTHSWSAALLQHTPTASPPSFFCLCVLLSPDSAIICSTLSFAVCCMQASQAAVAGATERPSAFPSLESSSSSTEASGAAASALPVATPPPAPPTFTTPAAAPAAETSKEAMLAAGSTPEVPAPGGAVEAIRGTLAGPALEAAAPGPEESSMLRSAPAAAAAGSSSTTAATAAAAEQERKERKEEEEEEEFLPAQEGHELYYSAASSDAGDPALTPPPSSLLMSPAPTAEAAGRAPAAVVAGGSSAIPSSERGSGLHGVPSDVSPVASSGPSLTPDHTSFGRSDIRVVAEEAAVEAIDQQQQQLDATAAAVPAGEWGGPSTARVEGPEGVAFTRIPGISVGDYRSSEFRERRSADVSAGVSELERSERQAEREQTRAERQSEQQQRKAERQYEKQQRQVAKLEQHAQKQAEAEVATNLAAQRLEAATEKLDSKRSAAAAAGGAGAAGGVYPPVTAEERREAGAAVTPSAAGEGLPVLGVGTAGGAAAPGLSAAGFSPPGAAAVVGPAGQPAGREDWELLEKPESSRAGPTEGAHTYRQALGLRPTSLAAGGAQEEIAGTAAVGTVAAGGDGDVVSQGRVEREGLGSSRIEEQQVPAATSGAEGGYVDEIGRDSLARPAGMHPSHLMASPESLQDLPQLLQQQHLHSAALGTIPSTGGAMVVPAVDAGTSSTTAPPAGAGAGAAAAGGGEVEEVEAGREKKGGLLDAVKQALTKPREVMQV